MENGLNSPSVQQAKSVTKERLETVIRCTIKTVQLCPNDLPQAPDGWLEMAEAALKSGDEAALMMAGLEMRVAHSQYRAEFDSRVALYELRKVLPGHLRSYVAAGLPVEHLFRPARGNQTRDEVIDASRYARQS